MGRTREPGEPEWLPEDRDAVDLYHEFAKSRHECGRWSWEHEDLEGLELDFQVCPFCQEVAEFADGVRERRKNMYGVTFGYYPSRSAESG